MKMLADGLNVAPMLAAIRPAMWDEITARQDFAGSPHRDTRSILLRGPVNVANAQDDVECIAYPATQHPGIRPAFEDLLSEIPIDMAELGRVMLVSLKPGGHITRHADEGAYAERFSRFHVALQSDDGNEFVSGIDAARMKPGECWWFDHRLPHEVINRSARERIHLIFDARVSGLYQGE